MDKDEKKLIVDTGKKGNEFDKSKVVKDISAQAQSVELEPYTIETYEKDQDKPDAAVIAKDVNTEAKNATVNKKDGKTIEEAVDGVKVEESAISSAIGDASQQSYSIPVELTKAEVNGITTQPTLTFTAIPRRSRPTSSRQSGRPYHQRSSGVQFD